MKTRRVVGTVLVSTIALWLCAAPHAPAEQPGKSPVKVFILAGQSNMEGHGKVEGDPNRNGGVGSLTYLVKQPETAARYKHIVRPGGGWVVRDDVWIWYLGRKGNLTVGYGAREGLIGPEFQFGHVVGDALEEQALLIKTSWGGKSLAVDFRPPRSGKLTFEPGKGLQAKIDKDPQTVGKYYRLMLAHVRDVLKNLKAHFPSYDGRGYEIAGFGWHQGWNDGCNATYVAEYEQNLANLIRDLRKDLAVKDLPVVIANSGFGGRLNTNARRLGIMNAQLAVADPAKYPEFRGTVTTVETRDFFRPPEVSPSRQGYHWNHNAETHFLIGNAMGKAMVELLTKAPSATR